jgi:protein gp37
MGAETKIQWCHSTFNPWWGCVEDGPECDRCYARAFAKRTGNAVWGHDSPRRFFGEKRWKEPLKWNREAEEAGERRRVFCGSMMDVCERRNDAVGAQMDAERAKLWALIERTPWLDWLLLTKRPQNFPAVVPSSWMKDGFPLNVWTGTTAGNQPGWDKRVKYLERLPVGITFVSCEPLLGPIDMGEHAPSWLIVGAESGGGARDCWLGWMRDLIRQCRDRETAPFVKQLGRSPFDQTAPGDEVAVNGRRVTWAKMDDDTSVRFRLRLVDQKGGDIAEFPPELQVREFPQARAA